jgi:hypothetical protein
VPLVVDVALAVLAGAVIAARSFLLRDNPATPWL